jgi:hypothetical protein
VHFYLCNCKSVFIFVHCSQLKLKKMNIINFNDGMKSGSVTPRLYLVKGLEFRKFEGSSIPGFCAVNTANYVKNGKWSNTSYSIVLPPGVKSWYMCSPMHGIYGENYGTWGEMVADLNMPYEVVKAVIEIEYKRTAKRLNELEEFVMGLEEGVETETVVISFGSPTNRQISEGWWETPKTGYTSTNQEVEITPGENGWKDCFVSSHNGAKVSDVSHRPGMHGGYYTVTVEFPSSATPKQVAGQEPEDTTSPEPIDPAAAFSALKNIFN